MATNYSPLLINTAGKIQRFGAEEALVWNFTSAAGDPLTLQVGGAPYFTFNRTGAFLIESNILWNADSGGDIGAQFDTRPGVVNIATTVAVGAVLAGALPGAKLELNKLTLGHADVDKYIDAEQGLVNTPALRYNAVNTRWEFSDNGIAYTSFNAGFGAVAWDTVYAADKTLLINSTVLTFDHTNTSGIGFTVSRNLPLANTDNPPMTVEQLHAADDQPALAIGQNTGTISALDIYDGTVAAGTKSFGFVAEGQMTIATNALLAAAAIDITQNDDDEPFVAVTGTAAGDASKNISTVNGVTADVFRVTVGGATRWVSAYASHILPGAPTWDAIYAVDKTLDINAAVLTFDQSTASGIGFTVSRNLDLTNTDNPIMRVVNNHTGDDRAALHVSGGIADVVATVPTLHVETVSAGMATGAGNLSYGVQSEVAPNAGDLAGSLLESFHATITGVAGAATASGFRADTGFTYGVYTLSPVYVEAPADILGVEIISTVTAGVGVLATNSISYTSPTLLGADDVILLEIAAAQNAGDNAASFTTGLSITNAVVGGSTVNTALLIDANWQSGITSGSPVTVTHIAVTGTALDVSRNLALASTNSPIVRFDNDNTGDDQATLVVTGGIADIVAAVPVVYAAATSAGMATGAGNDLYGVQSDVAPHALDGAGADLEAFHATITGAGAGAATAYGFRAETGFTYGVYTASPVYIAAPADVLGVEIISTVAAGVGVLSTNSISYTSPVLNAADDVILLEIAAAQNAGDNAASFTTGLSITNAVVGGATVNTALLIDANWQSGITSGSPVHLLDNAELQFGTTGTARLEYITAQTPDALMLGVGAISNSLIVCEEADIGSDCAHALQTDPTIFIHSTLDPATDNGEYLGWSYLGLNAGIMEINRATFDLTISAVDAFAGAAGANRDGGNIILTAGAEAAGGVAGIVQVTTQFEADYTFDAIVTEVNQTKIVSASPVGVGLGNAGIATQQKFEYTPDALDNANSLIVGAWYDMVAAPPAGNFSTAILIGDDPTVAPIVSSWSTGIACYAKKNLFEYSGAVSSTSVFNIACDPSNVLIAAEHLQGLNVTMDGNVGDNATSFIWGITSDLDTASGGTATAFRCQGILWDRAFVSQGGLVEIDGSEATTLVIIGQSGVGNILELKDGTVAAGTQRFVVDDTGQTIITTTNDLAVEVLQLVQSDIDQEFVYFNGTPTNPAAGVVPADNLTEVNGTGAVVGPQAPAGSPDTGWAFYGMIKIKVDAVGGGTADVWIPGFQPAVT